MHSGNVPKVLDLRGDRQVYLSFKYLSCELTAIPADLHRESDNIVACLNLPNMAYEPAQRVAVYAAAVRGLERLEPNPDRRLKYLDFIELYAALDDNERELFRQSYPPEADTMSAYFDRLRAEGYALGRQQGASALLVHLLQRKFGDLPEDLLRRVEQADPETLLEWSDRMITADRIDDVLP